MLTCAAYIDFGMRGWVPVDAVYVVDESILDAMSYGLEVSGRCVCVGYVASRSKRRGH